MLADDNGVKPKIARRFDLFQMFANRNASRHGQASVASL